MAATLNVAFDPVTTEAPVGWVKIVGGVEAALALMISVAIAAARNTRLILLNRFVFIYFNDYSLT